MDLLLWKNSETPTFWKEIASCDHLVQIYENDAVLLNTLEGFAVAGLKAGDSVVIIATQEHIDLLNKRLIAHNFNLLELALHDRYIVLEAGSTLAGFMVDGWPDEGKFNAAVSDIMQRARGADGKRFVRAYGEMVAILWSHQMKSATIALENLWNELHHEKDFQLFCAYPKDDFIGAGDDAPELVCKTHHVVVDGSEEPGKEIRYRYS